jgi:hypothetical protein
MTGDIAGVPVTEAARWRAQSWSPEDFDVTEWACRPHAWAYSLEGPLSALRIWAEIDQATQKVIAYHGHLNMQEQESTIWMDGRPHPPANALHTWSGFSTGEWDGDTLVVTTTHVKEAYLRRSGLMQSDQATVRTRWRRMGNYLQATVIIYDAVMMTEPYIRSTMMWVNDPAMNMSPYPCEEATENRAGTRPRAALSSGQEPAARARSESDRQIRHTLRAAAWRRRHDVPRVHRQAQDNAPAAKSDDGWRRGRKLARCERCELCNKCKRCVRAPLAPIEPRTFRTYCTLRTFRTGRAYLFSTPVPGLNPPALPYWLSSRQMNSISSPPPTFRFGFSNLAVNFSCTGRERAPDPRA